MIDTNTQTEVLEGTQPILLFDGVCNLCDGLVQFIIKLDPEGKFRFASLQSELGQQLTRKAGLEPNDIGTAILYQQGKFYLKSDMALGVARELGGLWNVFRIFSVIPRPWRNAIYNWVARNRYQWFGKKDQCMMPIPELRSRFLD